MADIDVFKFSEFGGISIQVPRPHPNVESYVLNIRECLQHIRRTPSGDILLNQIKFAVPLLGVSTHTARNEETRSLQFDISDNVVIIPMLAEYVQSGYMMWNGMQKSTTPGHNPPGSRFWRRRGASTEALDGAAADTPGVGSKAVIRFSNAVMSTNITSPPFIILAHELVHAAHYLCGHRWDGGEEERTTGIGQWAPGQSMQPLVSENQIRQEAGLPPRTSYA